MAFISISVDGNNNYLGVDVSSGITEKENFHKVYNCGDVTVDFINAIYFAYSHETVMLLFSSSVDQFVTDNCDKYHFIISNKLGDINIIVPIEVKNENDLAKYIKENKNAIDFVR